MEPWELSQGYLEISRQDLRENARRVTEAVGCPVIGVVKCDGYGVSAAEAAAAWESAGAAMLAVSEPEEALALRRAGFRETDLLLLSPVVSPGLLEALIGAGVILTVTNPDTARRYARLGGGRPVRVHVSADTGMGRFGLRWDDLEGFRAVYRTEGLQFEGCFSHFAASFEASRRMTALQLERFLSLTEALAAEGFPVGLRHMANSCAALRFQETRLDAVLVGSALVGRLPVTVPVELRRVGVYQAMVVDVRTLRRGDTTGYGAICRVRRDTRVAVVALGHQQGFGLVHRPECFRARDVLRHIHGLLRTRHTPQTVLYQGQALPVVGRVGTQFTLVDASGTDLAPGQYVSANVDMLLPPPRRRYV
ncbi:MAG: alanine racemase [Clostridiales bacterium]|nr:alanine racemase [Clostridiales bacterium]